MSLYQKLEGLLKSYEKHISFTFLSLLLITVLGLGFPLMLLAEEAAPITTAEPAVVASPAPATIAPEPVRAPEPTAIPVPTDIPRPVEENRPQNFGPNPDNGGEPHRPGPSEEDQQKMQAMMEQQQLKMQAQQLKMMQNGAKGTERGLGMFERQLKRVTGKGIGVPSDITDTLAKAKTIIAAMKNAKSIDEAQEAGMDELPELMHSLNEHQRTLEQLARWPQTLKQMDRALVQLQRQLKRDQTLAVRAAKNGFDLADQIAKFAEGITTLQTVRAQANEAVATDPEQAFMLAEDSFFSQLDDVMQSDKVINYIANISAFPRTFKNITTQLDRKIAQLKRKKVDTTLVAEDLDDLKAKGAAVLAAVRAKPIDEDAVVGALEDLRAAQEQLQNDLNEITDGSQPLPWEQGPKQLNFQPLSASFVQKIGPRQEQSGPADFERESGGPGSFGGQAQFNQGF